MQYGKTPNLAQSSLPNIYYGLNTSSNQQLKDTAAQKKPEYAKIRVNSVIEKQRASSIASRKDTKTSLSSTRMADTDFDVTIGDKNKTGVKW